MARRAERGQWNGGFVYGYRKDPETGRLEINKPEAEIVRRHIFDAFEKLGSVGRVQAKLKTLGIKYPSKRNSNGEPQHCTTFAKQQIRRALENEVYLGHVIWGEVRTENAHPPIVTQGQFKRVKRLLNENRRTRTNTVTAAEDSRLSKILFDVRVATI